MTESLDVLCEIISQTANFQQSISENKKSFYKKKDELQILLLESIKIAQSDQHLFDAEVKMLEEKLERIEKRLSNDHEAVDRL